jgi:3-hydroxybutyryl-CoA dehydrogenase
VLPSDRPLRVAVVGAGLMGTQIGCEYALGGHEATLVARRAELVSRRVDQALAAVELYDLRAPEETAAARGRIAVAGSLDAVDEPVDLVVESVAEDFDVKAEVLGRAAEQFPEAVLATNTSSLGITRLGRALGAGRRTLGTHYWNPPLLMPLVELVAGEDTSGEVVDDLERVLRDLGKRPVRVKDVPGFAWNRLQLALLREAVWLVEHGVATPETVDEIVRAGLARRWRLTGPFETAALGGAETFERVAANLFPLLSDAARIDGLERWVPSDAETLDAARQRRDAELADELRREGC